MSTNGNGASESRILTLDQVGRKDKDAQGRVLRHAATVWDVHQIVTDECDKIHQFYLKQIPPFVANMVQDALVGYGLIQPVPVPVPPETAVTPSPIPAELTGTLDGSGTPGPDAQSADDPLLTNGDLQA